MNALSISNLTKTYSDGFQALNGLNLEVSRGDFFALLGPNGAGKSTIIGITASLVNKSSGNVSIFGADIALEPERAKSYIGIVPQEFNFNVFEQVQEILITQAGYYGIPPDIARPRAEKLLKLLELWDKRDSRSRALSGGMKRRLMIARALMHEPQLLILDEPTAGVDIEQRRLIWKFLQDLNEAGTTIILTTHYLEEAENLCRNIAIIDNGNILYNSSVKQLLSKLNKETFILYSDQAILSLPETSIFKCHLIDKMTIEVEIDSNINLNNMFELFSESGITIISMKNKVNRLEELFLTLTRSQRKNNAK